MKTPARSSAVRKVREAIACLFFLSTPSILAQNPEFTNPWIEFKPIRAAIPVEPTPTPETVPVTIVEPPADTLNFTAPRTTYQVRPDATTIAKSFTQPVNYEYRLEALPVIVMQYTGETRMENVWAGSYLMGNLGFTNRVSFTASLTRAITAIFRLQSDSRVGDTSQMDYANRAEVALASRKLLGFTASATGGLASITGATGAVVDQQYVRMELLQDLPALPVRVRVAPSLVAEHRAETDRFLTGLDYALLINATQQTVFAAGAAQLSAVNAADGSTTSDFHSFYAQVEQRLSPDTTVSVRATYEEHIVNEVPNDAAMFLGVNSSFPLTETIRGGLQLRQRMAEILSGAKALPETLLSFSLGGGF